jgi:hypothetical protein
MFRIYPAPDALRVDLAHTLGFPNYPIDTTAEPYLNYLTNRYIGGNTLEAYIRLLKETIGYFDVVPTDHNVASTPRTIQGLLDVLSTTDTESFGHTKTDIEDTMLYAIGTWTMLLSSFVLLPMAGGIRKVTLAYNLRTRGTLSGCQPYQEDVAGLIMGSDLLPGPAKYTYLDGIAPEDGNLEAAVRLCSLLNPLPASASNAPAGPRAWAPSYETGRSQWRVSLGFFHNLDSLESLSIKATRLNAHTLSVFGAVDVAWTHNLSRHLLLSKRDGQYILEVFALPCALGATSLSSETAGISSELAQEIRESYSLLFNAWPKTSWHSRLGRQFCWCWSCSARRHRSQVITSYKKFNRHRTLGAKGPRDAHGSEYDPLLVELMNNEPSDWTPDLFPNLWSRVMVLEEHLQGAKPWSIWVLFRDRRDTLQFWTFL